MDQIGVLFVCLGNICRSPLAEGAFRHLVESKGLEDRFFIDSAGTSTWHLGKAPHTLSCEVSRQSGFDISAGRARQVTREDYAIFHYILAMDKNNLWELKDRKPSTSKSQLGLILDFADVGIREVPDPYYGGPEDYKNVLELVTEGAQGLFQSIHRDHF